MMVYNRARGLLVVFVVVVAFAAVWVLGDSNVQAPVRIHDETEPETDTPTPHADLPPRVARDQWSADRGDLYVLATEW